MSSDSPMRYNIGNIDTSSESSNGVETMSFSPNASPSESFSKKRRLSGISDGMAASTTIFRGESIEPKKDLNFSTPQTFVTIIVGKDAAQQTFVVHKQVICHYSPFFEKVFNSKFVEDRTQTMVLDDIEASIFGYFVNWLYVQRIVDAEGHNLNLINYAKLWVLADRFMMETLAETILMAIEKSKANDVTRVGNTLQDFQAYAYSTCPGSIKNSPLKKVAIKRTMEAITSYNRRELINRFPEGMLADFTEAVLDKCDGMQRRLSLRSASFISQPKLLTEQDLLWPTIALEYIV